MTCDGRGSAGMLAHHDRIAYRGSYQPKPVAADFISHFRILGLKKDLCTFNFFVLWNQGLEEMIHVVGPAYGLLRIIHFITCEYKVNRL